MRTSSDAAPHHATRRYPIGSLPVDIAHNMLEEWAESLTCLTAKAAEGQ
jgi:hypothetical protein